MSDTNGGTSEAVILLSLFGHTKTFPEMTKDIRRHRLSVTANYVLLDLKHVPLYGSGILDFDTWKCAYEQQYGLPYDNPETLRIIYHHNSEYIKNHPMPSYITKRIKIN